MESFKQIKTIIVVFDDGSTMTTDPRYISLVDVETGDFLTDWVFQKEEEHEEEL